MRKTLISTLACLCFFLSFNSLNAQFETELRLIPTDCDYGMTAFLAYAENNTATYDWGDGTSQVANWAYVEHAYDGPGEYTVTVINNSITYVETVSIEECTCPSALEAIEVYGQCSSVSLTVDTYLYSSNLYNVEWTWGDGSTSVSSWGYPTGYHTYAEEGEYEICGFFTGPGCEDGTTLCTTTTIEFCDEPCYYEEPIIEFDELNCTYNIGVIEAPQEIIWTVNGEVYQESYWLYDLELPAGENEICLEILPNLDWNCPLGYTECLNILVEENQCAEPEFSYEETSCGLLQFEFSAADSLDIQSVSFGNGVIQDLTYGEDFEHYYSPIPGLYEVCIMYYEPGTTIISELCYGVEVEGCPEEFCWMEVWGQEVECGVVHFNAFTELDIFQEQDVFWSFGDGTDQYGWSWTEHIYEEPGTYTVCAEMYSPYCENEFLVECFTITIEECEEECTEPISLENLECGLWEFTIGENWSVEFATWDFGDGETTEVPFNNVLSTTHEYDEPGVYEVCVNYYDLSCNGMTEECFEIEVETCSENCNAITYEFLDCLQAEFMFDGESDGFYDQWQVSIDGSIIYDYETLDGTGTVIQFPFEGIYTISVTDALNCNGDIEPYSINIYVEDCAPCPEIITDSLECLNGTFSFNGEISGGSYCWELWQNGSMLTTYFDESQTQMAFPGAGVYQVGVTNALNCNGVSEPYFITVTVEDCDSECPEIIVENLECDYGLFSYEGEIDYSVFSSLCWEVYDSNNQLLSTYLDGQLTDYTFLEPGTYYVSVTNAVPCNGEIPVIQIEVPECESECPEIYTEYTECLYGGFYYEGSYSGDILFWELWQGDVLVNTYFGDTYLDIEFIEGGAYTLTVINALNCYGEEEPYSFSFWMYDCEDCNFELEYLVDCNELIVLMPDSSSNFYIDYGNGVYGEILETVTYDEPGIYTICYEVYLEECEQWTGGCVDVEIEDCESECVPMTLSLDADYGGLDNVTELISAVIMGDDGNPVWEELIPFSTFITSIEVELCVPPGCYTFEILNEDPLLLAGLSLAIESVETEGVEIESEIDLLNGSYSAMLAVQSECTVGVEEAYSEISIYPVPSAGDVTLSFSSEGWSYDVLDVTGKLVHSKTNANALETMNVSAWSNGIYLVRAYKNTEILTKKIEVSH